MRPAADTIMGDARALSAPMRHGHFTPSSRAYHWKAVRAAAGWDKSLYLATRHFAGWYMRNELRLDSEDVAVALGHRDGGALVRSTYGHLETGRALDRVAQAYEAVQCPAAACREGRRRVVIQRTAHESHTKAAITRTFVLSPRFLGAEPAESRTSPQRPTKHRAPRAITADSGRPAAVLVSDGSQSGPHTKRTRTGGVCGRACPRQGCRGTTYTFEGPVGRVRECAWCGDRRPA